LLRRAVLPAAAGIRSADPSGLVVIVAVVTITIVVRLVVVLETAMVAIPVTGVVAVAVMMRRYPMSTGIGRTCPVAGMPVVVAVYGIPLAINPQEVRPRGDWPDGKDVRRGWRSNLDADRDLSLGALRAQEQQ